MRAQQARGAGIAVLGINLLAPFGKPLGEAVWYTEFIFSRRVSFAHACGEDLARVVVDCDSKLSGRISGRECAELSHCAALGVFCATPCSRAL